MKGKNKEIFSFLWNSHEVHICVFNFTPQLFNTLLFNKDDK